MYECIGNRNCGGSPREQESLKEPKFKRPLVNDDSGLIQNIQHALEELEKKVESRYASLFAGMHNFSDLNNRVHILTDKLRQQESIISSWHDRSELNNTVNGLTQRLSEHEELLQGIVQKNQRMESSRKQGEESFPIAEENPAIPISNQQVTDIGMKGLQEGQAALSQRVTDVENSTFTLKEDLVAVFTKGPQCEAFRRSLLDDFGLEIDKRLNITKTDHEPPECAYIAQSKETHLHLQDEPDVDPSKDRICSADEPLEEEGVTLQESLWDATLLIGWRGMHIIPNILLVLLVCANIFGQFLFCAVIDSQFTDPGLPDPDRMEYWRAGAHAQVNQDPITGATLLSRVCNQDSALSVADSQVDVVANAESYQASVCVLFFPCMATGPATFAVAWLLWALVAVNESIAALNLLVSYAHRPRSGRTQIERREDGFEVVSLSLARLLFMVAITITRLVVCGSIFVFGTMWLAYTVNVQNLVLNASALGFVLDMDNLLFDAFMPPVVKAVLTSLKPIPLPHAGKPGTALNYASYNIGLRPAFATLVIAFVFIWTWTHQVTDMDNQLTTLMDTLCTGDRDFMWLLNGDLSILLATPTPRYVNKVSDFDLLQDYKLNAVKQMWNRTIDPNSQVGRKRDWLAYLTANENVYNLLGNTPVRDLTYNNAVGNMECDSSDYSTFTEMGLNSFIVNGVRQMGNNLSAVGCWDIALGCGFGNGSNLRLYCPSQCGCGNPRSGLYYGGPSKGCPRDKCLQSISYTSELSKIACEDPEDVNDYFGWNRYWTEFEVAQVTDLGNLFYMTINGQDYNATEFAYYARQLGCGLLQKPEIIGAFCFETDVQASVATFCPVRCGCRLNPNSAGCPTTCQIYEAWYLSSLTSLPCRDVLPGELTQTGNPFNDWAQYAELRYTNSYMINVVLEDWQTTRPDLAATIKTPKEFWLYISANGCETVGTWICSEILGPFSGFSLCGEFCGCGTLSNSMYCPEICLKIPTSP